jgi:hypothetical protein
VFGQIPVATQGGIERVNATPSEYLRRQALQNKAFGSDLRLEGVSVSDKPSMVIGEKPGQPSFVVSQQWMGGEDSPTLNEISSSLKADGFLPVPKSYFGWYRPSDRLVIIDAKPDNFIKHEGKVTPLDLQMADFSEEEVRRSGLDKLKP